MQFPRRRMKWLPKIAAAAALASSCCNVAMADAPSVLSGNIKRAPTDSDLNQDKVNRTKIFVDRHPFILKDECTVQGVTKGQVCESDEDDNNYWLIAPDSESALFTDLDGDGKGDAALFYTCNDDLHLVVLKNQAGRPIQLCDFILEHKYSRPAKLTFNGGTLTAEWQIWEPDRSIKRQFKIGGGKVAPLPPTGDATTAATVQSIALSANPQDVANPKIPGRIPKILSRDPVDSGIKTEKLTQAVILKGLKAQKKKLNLVDDYNGFGNIKKVVFADLNGDGRNDAAVLFSITHADNDELRLIPAVLDHGTLKFVGETWVGAGGFDTVDEKLTVNSGIMQISVKTFDKSKWKSQARPWVAMRFKLHDGNRLIKLR